MLNRLLIVKVSKRRRIVIARVRRTLLVLELTFGYGVRRRRIMRVRLIRRANLIVISVVIRVQCSKQLIRVLSVVLCRITRSRYLMFRR